MQRLSRAALGAAILLGASLAPASAQRHPVAPARVAPHAGAIVSPDVPRGTPFLELNPLALTIQLLKNPPNCECPILAVGQTTMQQLVASFGTPTAVNGNTATWQRSASGQVGNVRVTSMQNVTASFDANGVLQAVANTFTQSPG